MYKRVYSSRADTKLFTLFVKPHKPVSSNSVARWIKSVLSNAPGYRSTSVSKAHSAHGSSFTNAYKRGVPEAEILRTAESMNERTFRIISESRLFLIYVIQDSLLEDLSAINYVTTLCSHCNVLASVL